MPKLPPLNALKSFASAAEHLSFTSAAKELFVTQAAISHQIKTLEEFLGVKLFLRKSKSPELTPAGQIYYNEIKDIFSNLIKATEQIKNNQTKSLTVATTPSFATLWLVPRLFKFNELYPDIDVQIQAVDREEGHLNDNVDVAIYYGQGNWPNLTIDKLRNEELLPVCAPSYLEKHPLTNLQDLSNISLLHDGNYKSWRAYFKLHNLNGNNTERGPIFSHSSLVLQACSYGQGVALAHTLLALPDINSGRLVFPFKDAPLVSKNAYYLVCEEDKSQLSAIQAFRNWIITNFKNTIIS